MQQLHAFVSADDTVNSAHEKCGIVAADVAVVHMRHDCKYSVVRMSSQERKDGRGTSAR